MRHESSVVVNRPIDEVWLFMTDPFHAPRIGGITLGVRRTSPGPRGLGSRFEVRVVILGLEARMTGSVTEWNPPHAVTFSLSGAGMRSYSMRGTLEATADGTKVVRVIEFVPVPILKLLWPVLGPFVRRRWEIATQNVRRLLEAGPG